MPSFLKERPTPVRRLLVYVVIFVTGLALGELFGRNWRSNFIVVAVLAFEAAWLVPRLRADEGLRFKPVGEWVNSSNLFGWIAFATVGFFYVRELWRSLRVGEPDISPGFLLLPLLLFLAASLIEHVFKAGEPR